LLLANGIGAIVGPILATTVMLGVGASGLFYAAAAPRAALARYAALRIHRYARVEQDRYESLTQTTPAVLELDPRAPARESRPFQETEPDRRP
jgi:hypothetical protein